MTDRKLEIEPETEPFAAEPAIEITKETKRGRPEKHERDAD